MTDSSYYVVRWLAGDKERFLLWRDGGSEPDRYATLPDTGQLLTARTKQELLSLAGRNRLDVSEQEPHVIDLHAVGAILDRLRPNRPLSDRAARVLLDAWNALEDLARSVGTPFMDHDLPRDRVELLYDKLFHGNNLPSVTPEGDRFHPLLSDHERQWLRTLLRRASNAASVLI